MESTSTESTTNTTLPAAVIAKERTFEGRYAAISELRWHWCKDPSNDKRVTQTVYADLCGVTRQAVSQSISKYEAANPSVVSAPNVDARGGSTKGQTSTKAVDEVDGVDIGSQVPTKGQLKADLTALVGLGRKVSADFQALAPTMTKPQLSKALRDFDAVINDITASVHSTYADLEVLQAA